MEEQTVDIDRLAKNLAYLTLFMKYKYGVTPTILHLQKAESRWFPEKSVPSRYYNRHYLAFEGTSEEFEEAALLLKNASEDVHLDLEEMLHVDTKLSRDDRHELRFDITPFLKHPEKLDECVGVLHNQRSFLKNLTITYLKNVGALALSQGLVHLPLAKLGGNALIALAGLAYSRNGDTKKRRPASFFSSSRMFQDLADEIASELKSLPQFSKSQKESSPGEEAWAEPWQAFSSEDYLSDAQFRYQKLLQKDGPLSWSAKNLRNQFRGDPSFQSWADRTDRHWYADHQNSK